jgi:thiol-disulfide isomerase/thioredoxin
MAGLGTLAARNPLPEGTIMKMRMLFQTMSVLAGVTFAVDAQAQESKLKIGDAAPKLQVGKWVQGEPVKEFAKDKAYIVEFWATWCGPCRVSIPHLNELHEKFKDKGLVVIGQDVWERDESLVEPFVKKMGDKMTYRVAMDDKSKEEQGAMAITWMKAAGQNGIPAAFVVNKQGKIAWIGHPMSLKEQVLEDVLADRYDLAKAAAEKAQEESNRAQLTELSRKLNTSMSKKNWDDAEKTVTEMEKLLPAGMRSGLSMTRFQILTSQGNYDAAYKVVADLSDAEPDNAMLQNQIAWTIASRKDLEKRDLALAEKIAERANKAAKGKDPNTLDTLARIQFMNGKKSQAIETEQKAVDLAEGEMKEEFKKFLASYKEGKLPEVDE